nr:TetR family transcriptional regulator [Pseudomonadota bacterium]
MRAEARERRKAAIEAAAIELLLDQGYDNLSMLAVAKKAKASNETLYRWYGDKTG